MRIETWMLEMVKSVKGINESVCEKMEQQCVTPQKLVPVDVQSKAAQHLREIDELSAEMSEHSEARFNKPHIS